jgi:hypothetical protein
MVKWVKESSLNLAYKNDICSFACENLICIFNKFSFKFFFTIKKNMFFSRTCKWIYVIFIDCVRKTFSNPV